MSREILMYEVFEENPNFKGSKTAILHAIDSEYDLKRVPELQDIPPESIHVAGTLSLPFEELHSKPTHRGYQIKPHGSLRRSVPIYETLPEDAMDLVTVDVYQTVFSHREGVAAHSQSDRNISDFIFAAPGEFTVEQITNALYHKYKKEKEELGLPGAGNAFYIAMDPQLTGTLRLHRMSLFQRSHRPITLKYHDLSGVDYWVRTITGAITADEEKKKDRKKNVN